MENQVDDQILGLKASFFVQKSGVYYGISTAFDPRHTGSLDPFSQAYDGGIMHFPVLTIKE